MIELNDFLRRKAGCALETPVFKCLKDKTVDEIEGYRFVPWPITAEA